MIYFFFERLKKKFIFILFLIFFFSINSEPWKINIFSEKINLIDYFNYFRGLLPIIVGLITFYYQIFKKKLYKNFDIIFILFFLYSLFQFIGLLLNFPVNQYDNFIYRIYFLLLLFFSTFLFLTIEKKDLEKMLMLIIILILAINLYFTTIASYEFLSNKLPFYYQKVFQADNIIFNSPSIRSTGLARICLILFLFALIYLERVKNKYFVCLIIINLLIIFLLQSRLNIYSLFFFLVFYLFFFKNFSNKERLKYFFVLSIIPLLVYHSIKFDRPLSTETKIGTNIIKSNIQNNNIIFNPNKHQSLYNFSTGRNEIWKDLLIKEKDLKQFIFGFGTQADRVITSPAFFSASNSYVYIYICSGILGLLIFAIYIFYIMTKIFKLLYINKIFSINGNIFLKFSVLIFIYLLIRSIVESSFAIYSIDYFLFIISSKIILFSRLR